MTRGREQEALLQWYDLNRRILPWREDPTPYHVWLSEIMLQQTRVEAVKGYYERFLAVLPDIASLANAEEDVYLKLWEGLGYYSRVRNLHKAAQQIMEQYDGEMPRTAQELRKLAGIGPYTAAAIASIAFGEKVPAVDGNLLRIFARRTAYSEDIKSPQAKKEAEFFFGERISEERPGEYNQALMDLGATVCLPNGAPHCGICPWSSRCTAHEQGCETAYPVAAPRKARRIDDKTVFLIYYADLLALAKRPAKGLLAGLYEFPNTAGWLSQEEALDYVQKLGFSALQIRPLPEAKHIFTHREWHMTGYEIRADEWRPVPEKKEKTDVFLVSEEEMRDKYSIPSAFSCYVKEIRFGDCRKNEPSGSDRRKS